MQPTHVVEEAARMPHDSPLLRVYSLGSDEGSMTLNELTVLCTTLSKKVETLESDLKQTKLTYGAAYTKLIMKVKKLEHKTQQLVSETHGALDLGSTRPKSKNVKVRVNTEESAVKPEPELKNTIGCNLNPSDGPGKPNKKDYTAKPDISTANVPVSTAGAEVSTASPEVKTAAKSLVYIRRSVAKRKDKGKAIMKEAEPVQKKTKLQLEQERLGLEEALRLQEQLDKEERLQAQERERNSEADKARLLNMGTHTLQQLKKLSINEVKELFETTMKRVNTFTPIKSDDTVPKVVAGSSKIDTEQELNQERSKRQKIGEGSKLAEESKDELSQEQLQQLMIIKILFTAVPVSTVGAEVSTANLEVKTAAESLVYIRKSAAKRKDKGKATMKEVEPVQKKTDLQLEQEGLGLEEALRLQEQLDEEERQRIARVHKEASTFNAKEWDNIEAQIEADEELAHRLQAQERERYSEADKARLLVELINERKRKFAQQRAEQRRNKPMNQAQQMTYMCNYIKNIRSHTLQQLKKLSFDEVKKLFETTMKRVNTFTPIKSDDTVPKVIAGSSKRDAEQELNQGYSKRQKIGEGSKPAE
ncbi:hypothetical protein Tco_0986531 [Tanacetum coccineum]